MSRGEISSILVCQLCSESRSRHQVTGLYGGRGLEEKIGDRSLVAFGCRSARREARSDIVAVLDFDVGEGFRRGRSDLGGVRHSRTDEIAKRQQESKPNLSAIC